MSTVPSTAQGSDPPPPAAPVDAAPVKPMRGTYNATKHFWTCNYSGCKVSWATLADVERHYDRDHLKLKGDQLQHAAQQPRTAATATVGDALGRLATAHSGQAHGHGHAHRHGHSHGQAKPSRKSTIDLEGLTAIQRIDKILAAVDRTIKELERDEQLELEMIAQQINSNPPRGSKRSSPSYEDEYLPPGAGAVAARTSAGRAAAAAAAANGGDAEGGGKRQRRQSSQEDKALKAAASRFMHLQYAWLTDEANERLNSSEAARRRDGVQLDDEERRMLEAAYATMGFQPGTAPDTTKIPDKLNRRIQHLMTVSRAETTNRLRHYAPQILGVPSKVVGDLDNPASEPLWAKDGLGWTYIDVDKEHGYLRSPRVIEACSMVLYGQLSLGKKSARARATAGESNKGASWQLREIPPALVALVVTIVRSVVRGEKSFRLTSGTQDSVESRKIYLQVYDDLVSTPAGKDALVWLKCELLLPPNDALTAAEEEVKENFLLNGGKGKAAAARRAKREGSGSAATSRASSMTPAPSTPGPAGARSPAPTKPTVAMTMANLTPGGDGDVAGATHTRTMPDMPAFGPVPPRFGQSSPAAAAAPKGKANAPPARPRQVKMEVDQDDGMDQEDESKPDVKPGDAAIKLAMMDLGGSSRDPMSSGAATPLKREGDGDEVDELEED